MPVDPGKGWLAAGITGLPRQREWDAVATVAAPGSPGEEAGFVALADGSFVVESAPDAFDPAPLAAALEARLAPPFRAAAHRRDELWAVGACAIEVTRLDPDPGGSELELIWDGSLLALSVDRMPSGHERASALERVASARETGPYAAHARRLRGDLWELSVLPL